MCSNSHSILRLVCTKFKITKLSPIKFQKFGQQIKKDSRKSAKSARRHSASNRTEGNKNSPVPSPEEHRENMKNINLTLQHNGVRREEGVAPGQLKYRMGHELLSMNF